MAVFKVWWPDNGHTQDDARKVDACDHESAAMSWAHWYDGWYGDYAIVSGEEAEVMVLADGDETPVAVFVNGYQERAYYGNVKR